MKILCKLTGTSFIVLISFLSCAQVNWQKVDHLYAPLPNGFHIYKTTSELDGKPNIAFYITADLDNKQLEFTVDTTYKRRLTPQQFFEKNKQPLLIVNGTFFSFETNQNLNIVIKDGEIVSHNVRKVRAVKGDTTSAFIDEKIKRSAIGINKKRKADIAWISSDSTAKYADAWQTVHSDTNRYHSMRWKMETAIGGGPVIVQDGKVFITNEQEKMFVGKAIDDKHPRTAMGYTKDGKFIIMVIQGRTPGVAEGATLKQEAELLAGIGCVEALNLDGGGSSCMLVNGKETIWPSDKGLQRPVPAVFIIHKKK